jgi:carbon monoxide dehydrogenase subunit G
VKPIELEVAIEAAPAAVFAAMTDPARMARWLPQTEAIEEASGPIGVTGATFVQRGAPGIRRPGGTVSADPPSSWHLRLAGYGERLDARFHLDPVADSTRLRLEARVNNGPAILAPIVNRLSFSLDRRIWSGALDRLKAEVERAPAAIHVGSVYSLDSRAGIFRIAQLLAADERHAHLRLYDQRFKKRPERGDLAQLRLGRPDHYAEVQPLGPTLRGAIDSRPNVAWLLADGGFGIAHMPVSREAFDDARPMPMFDAGVAVEHLAPITAWQSRAKRVFGEPPEPTVGAFISVLLEGHGFGIAKLLRSEFKGVHIRVYSNVFGERPQSVDEASIESRPPDLGGMMSRTPPSEPFAIGHLPLSHRSFVRWQPVVVALALVDPDELLGYEEWSLAKGGFF